MNKPVLAARKEAEHIKLLLGAFRSKLALLLVAVVMTWGLWATLQSGDEKLPAVEAKCLKYRQDLLSKWGLPPEVPIRLNSTLVEVFATLADPKHPEWKKALPPDKWMDLYGELQPEQDRCQQLTAAAYLVKIRVPYLVEPISIEGLLLADFWPFVMVAIAAATIVFQLRQRANAIVLSWLTFDNPDAPSRELLHIRSNYRVGFLHEKTIQNKPFLVYKPPFILQPESLFVWTLLGLTLYSSFSLEAGHRIELSHEMRSVLFDYLSAMWFFSITIAYLVYRTWRYHEQSLEAVVGRPVTGGTFSRLAEKWSAFLDAPVENKIEPKIYQALSRVPDSLGALAALAALGTLLFPWMEPGPIRGYTFLTGAENLGEGLATELRYQLYLAVVFVLLCMFRSLAHNRLSERRFHTLTKWTRKLGLVVVVLIGNLLFHMLILRILVASTWPSWSDFQNRPLIQTNPGIGFSLFTALIILLLPSPSATK